MLLVDVLVLGYVGGAEPIARNVILGQIASAYYFAHFLIILPIVSRDGAAAAAAQFDHRGGAGQAWRHQPGRRRALA